MEKHPDYPSLLAISDVLNNFKIENSAFNITFNDLEKAPCPFIAHTSRNDGDFVVVNKIEDEYFLLSDDKSSKQKLEKPEFRKIFKVVILVVEPDSLKNVELSASSPLNFAALLSKIKTTAITIVSALLLVSALVFNKSFISGLTWSTFLFTLIKTTGLITSVLLLVQSIDSNNPLVQVLCGGGGKTNCNAILSSKAAKLTDWLSWSEIGFFYFAGTWLLLLFGGNSPLKWQILILLNLVSLPYTFYSIYYQARIAKQWCLLCCIVQALLWLEFISLSLTLSKGEGTIPFNSLSFGEGWGEALSAIFICLLLPIILWAILKPLFLKIQQLAPLKNQLRKFKYNAELFNKLLTEQPKYAIPDEDWSIVLGNVEANNIITMITNPYCPPCAKTHKLLDELLNQQDDIQARIVFTAKNKDDDIKTPISRHLMALNNLPDKNIVRKALDDWYDQKEKNYEAWAKIYPLNLNGAEFLKIDKQMEWCQLAEVSVTPTLLLNGYRLPDFYQLPDLKYMLQ